VHCLHRARARRSLRRVILRLLQVLTDMARSIGATPWWSINTGYYQTVNGQQTSVQPTVTYKGYAAVPNNGLCWQARATARVGQEQLDCLAGQQASDTDAGQSRSCLQPLKDRLWAASPAGR
jgi:hypothetical protein